MDDLIVSSEFHFHADMAIASGAYEGVPDIKTATPMAAAFEDETDIMFPASAPASAVLLERPRA